MFRRYHLLILSLVTPAFIAGCPSKPVPVPPVSTPTPTPMPVVSFNPVVIGDFYKIQFGPGTKGFDFGPGSKGLEFGPGSKGLEFGPGTKGLAQLNFNVSLPQSFIELDSASFTTQAATTEQVKLQSLEVEMIADDQVKATISLTPDSNTPVKCAIYENGRYCDYNFGMYIDQEKYTLRARAEGNFEPLEMTGGYLNITKDENKQYRSDVRIILYKSEDNLLDIEINSRTDEIKS